MFRKIFMCSIIVLFLVSCSGSDNSKNDPMRDWGTKKSTAVPPKDFPGAPTDKKWNSHRG
jgi:hypothetical protein